MLTSLAGLGAAVFVDKASALSDLPLYDDRKAHSQMKVPYEAMDEDLPFATRNGIAQFRTDAKASRQRLVEAHGKLEADIVPLVDKAYWYALAHGSNHWYINLVNGTSAVIATIHSVRAQNIPDRQGFNR
jgi:hypothetical protein